MQPRKRGFQFTKGDADILECVYKCRQAHIDHLIHLTGRSRQALNVRLVRLTENGYLYRRRRPFERYVYAIGHRATPILTEQGVAEKEGIDAQRRRLREMKDLFLNHTLTIAQVRVVVELACRQGDFILHKWLEEGKHIYDKVKFREDGKEQTLPLQFDAFFTLEDTRRSEGKNKAHFFLEVDCGTATHTKFKKKLKAAYHYHDQKRHEKKFGIPNFRVLTVATTEQRAINLCEAAGEVLPNNISKFYYFTPLSHFSYDNPRQIFGEILMTPRDFKGGKRYSLIPPLK